MKKQEHQELNEPLLSSHHDTSPLRPHPKVAQPFAHRDLFRGHGEVKVWSLIPSQALEPFRAALWCELEPQGRVGRHVQEHYPEVVIGISGQGVAQIGDQSWALVTGACLPLPQGQTLSITNPNDAPLSYLIIKAEP